MRIYDITQELFTCDVYPGDPSPERETLADMAMGDLYNLTALHLCAHNGTHIDAPRHFIRDGKAVDEIPLAHCVGPCFVAEHEGLMTAADARHMMEKARRFNEEAGKRILIKGTATVSAEAAREFAFGEILLLGNESQTVGPEDAPMEVHLILLGRDVVLLEGIRLADVPEGAYFLSCAPLKLGGADGAPCRAILTDLM